MELKEFRRFGNTDFIFDENFIFSMIRSLSHHFLSPAILIFVSSAVGLSVLTLILKQPVPYCCLYCPLLTWLL